MIKALVLSLFLKAQMTPNTLTNLRHERQTLVDRAQAINEKYPTGRSMPQQDSTDLDNLLSDIERVDVKVAAIKSQNDNAFDEHLAQANGDTRVIRNVKDIRQHYTERGMGDRLENSVQLDDFLRGVAGLRSSPGVQNALAAGTDSAGGFLMPGRVMADILEALIPASSLLSAGAGILPLELGAKSFTTVAIENIPQAAWRNESTAVAMSDPSFRAVLAAPKSLAFYFKVSRELLADADNIVQALTTAITQSFARELDRAGLLGSGTAPEPRGLLNTSGVNAVANGANGTALGNYSNFFSGVNAVLSANAPMPTAAIMSPRSLTKLGGLVDTTGQPLNVPPMLQGMKQIATTAISNTLTVGTSTDCSQIFIGDFTRMVFAMRERMSIQLLDQTFATSGEVGFMCHCRADVMVAYPAAFAVVSGVRA